MQFRHLPLIGAVILAALAVFFVNVYLGQEQKVAREQAKHEIVRRQEMQATVVVAKKDIPKGTTIIAEMLDSKIVPKEYLQPQAVNYPERIVGMITLVPISSGEQIALTKLTSSKQTSSGSSLAMATPIGKRAVAVPVDNISSLMGMIKTGDYVDVIALIPVPAIGPDGKQVMQMGVLPIFQNVLVLAAGRELGRQSDEESRYGKSETGSSVPLITLALSPQEASLITFVQEQGKIRLVLRSPADSRIEPLQPASWETLFQYLMPQTQTKEQISASEVSPKEKGREIEIYRGLKKETITLSK